MTTVGVAETISGRRLSRVAKNVLHKVWNKNEDVLNRREEGDVKVDDNGAESYTKRDCETDIGNDTGVCLRSRKRLPALFLTSNKTSNMTKETLGDDTSTWERRLIKLIDAFLFKGKDEEQRANVSVYVLATVAENGNRKHIALLKVAKGEGVIGLDRGSREVWDDFARSFVSIEDKVCLESRQAVSVFIIVVVLFVIIYVLAKVAKATRIGYGTCQAAREGDRAVATSSVGVLLKAEASSAIRCIRQEEGMAESSTANATSLI